jgi:photosystem II stability/assembly factor-like uncharacterized protein
MKNVLAIFLLFFFTPLCFSQWVLQVSTSARDLFGIDMIDANTGFVCGDGLGRILKTTNGGINWIGYTEPTNDQYNAISFTDALTGLAVGPPGLVLRTANGGLNWSLISRPGGDMGPVQFVTPSIAYAAGDDIIKSTNGGLNWTVILPGAILSQFQGLYFIDENSGTVVGRPGLIMTTTNGGTSWIQRTMNLPVQFGDSTLFDVMYVNAQTGYACGNNGIVVKTMNEGVNWIYYPSGSNFALRGIKFLDTNIGFCVGQAGRIIRSTNGGINWTQQTSPTTDPLAYLDFTDYNNGWIVGFNGKILYTSNGGAMWVHPVSTEIPNSFSLSQNYPNPFNPTTIINFHLPVFSNVSLKIYDMLGSEVATLVNEELNSGVYEIEFDGSNYSSGVYFYSLSAGSYIETKKMILLK